MAAFSCRLSTGPLNVTTPLEVMIFMLWAFNESESSAIRALRMLAEISRSCLFSAWSLGVGVAELRSRLFRAVLSASPDAGEPEGSTRPVWVLQAIRNDSRGTANMSLVVFKTSSLTVSSKEWPALKHGQECYGRWVCR